MYNLKTVKRFEIMLRLLWQRIVDVSANTINNSRAVFIEQLQPRRQIQTYCPLIAFESLLSYNK